MSLRTALVVLLFVGCDESDDRSAHPIVLPPPGEQPKSAGPRENVSPLTPIVLPDVPVPPPAKPPPPPPPPERVDPKTPEPVPAEVVAPSLPEPEQPAPLKKKKR